jgi:histidyl-tRNA synthetase
MAERVKGVRDFLGKEAILRQTVIQKIREAYEAFGFEPLETPSLEYLSLFTDKSGPEIEAQLYSFSDKKGEKLALRPEHTLSRLRAVSENKSLIKPFKSYSIGDVWRYEDPGKGKYREFLQADIDIYGSSSIRYDAEIIACIDFVFKKLGISGYKIHLNNRKILQGLLDDLGILPTEGLQVLRELDKLNKVGEKEVLLRISVVIGAKKAEEIKKYIDGKYKLNLIGQKELSELVDYLKDYGIKDVVIDNSLIRGNAYYDGNIFEFVTESIGTIAGGGRYDKLSLQFGPSMPVVGAAIGFERIIEILKSTVTDDFIESYCVINIDNIKKAVEIATKLRETGKKTDLFLEDVSLSKGLSYCDANKIRYAVIIGNKDLKNGEITIRDLKEKKNKTIKLEEI